MSYTKTTWVNGTSPAISDTNLNKIEQGIYDAHEAIDGAVVKTLFDAYSILYADVDNTPAALSVAASRLVGRKSSGGIAALTAAEVKTLLAMAFTDLSDTPANYTGAAGKIIKVNSTPNALEFGETIGVATGQLFKIPGSIAQGDIFVVNSSGNVVRLAAGTNGYFLKTQGAGADPVWASIGGGGDMLKSTYDPNEDGIIASAQLDPIVFLIDGSRTMTGNLNMDSYSVCGYTFRSAVNDSFVQFLGGTGCYCAGIFPYGSDHASYPGQIRFGVPNATKDSLLLPGYFEGVTNTPYLLLNYGLKCDTIVEKTESAGVTIEDIKIANHSINNTYPKEGLSLVGGPGNCPARLVIWDDDDEVMGIYKGLFTVGVPNATGSECVPVFWVKGFQSSPKVEFGYGIKCSTIVEKTTDAGVTIDELLIKDGGFSIGSDAQGDIYYRGSDSALKRLAPGTNGYFLKTQGAGADPIWGEVAGGGKSILEQTVDELATSMNNGGLASLAAKMFEDPLSAAEAASIIDSTNLTAAKAEPILDHANLSYTKRISIKASVTRPLHIWLNRCVTLNTARFGLMGCGTQFAGLSFGGQISIESEITEEYDGETWGSGGALNTKRKYAGGCGTLIAGLVFGGWGAGNRLVSSEEYDGATWSGGGDLDVAWFSLGSCGTQLAGLGFGGNSTVNTIENMTREYDGAAWVSGGVLNVARSMLAGCGTQTAGLSFAGYTDQFKVDTEEYDGSTWVVSGDLSIGRDVTSGAGIQTAGLCIGGDIGVTGTESTDSTEEYDGSTWSTGGNLHTKRHALAGCGGSNSAGSFGGLTSPATIQAITEEYW